MSKGTGKVSIGAGRDHPGKKLKVWLAQNALVLSVGLLLSMALYYPIVRDGLENLDSFCTAEPYWADQWEQIPYWETVQGRWGLRLCDALTAGMHPYFLTVLAVSVFYLLGTLLICDLLDIRSRYLRLVSAALVGCSQYVMNIQTYRYCSAAYAFSFFSGGFGGRAGKQAAWKPGGSGGALPSVFAGALSMQSGRDGCPLPVCDFSGTGAARQV